MINTYKAQILLKCSQKIIVTRNFYPCFRLNNKISSVSTKCIKPFLGTAQSFFAVSSQTVYSAAADAAAIICAAELLPKVPLPFI